ncbi:MAG: preprotein translocase subunit YajC [Labilithrix sp.]|nr:preprotein translocase subunit YajC [Labilithrix sp.]
MSLYFFQNVPPKQGTPGTTQEAPAGAPAQQSPPGGSMITMLLPFLILVPFLFMSFRRQKKEQEARKNLKKGDRVVTQAGLIGELVELEERIAKVKIAPGTTVQVLASAVSSFEAQPASKTDKELSDLKEAKATADKK